MNADQLEYRIKTVKLKEEKASWMPRLSGTGMELQHEFYYHTSLSEFIFFPRYTRMKQEVTIMN